MNILFHTGVGNKDRPERWSGICNFFSNLARVFESLGHDCVVYCHPRAISGNIYNKHIVSEKVSSINYNPDVIFTWNGMSEGDKEMVKKYGRDKFIFGELGFLNHYNTCYFDRSGTNARCSILAQNFNGEVDDAFYESIVSKYKKPKIIEGRYVFVPLQDEKDTQISMLSPFSTMYDLLEYVLDLYSYDKDIKILFKQHPHSRSRIPTNKKLKEVSGDVHHFLPYAEKVVGINSTVLTECLLYHNRLLAVGLGLPSRKFINDQERKLFIIKCCNMEIPQSKLSDSKFIKDSYLIKELLK